MKKPSLGGLNMNLHPGVYNALKGRSTDAVSISEAAFCLLEPVLRNVSPLYAKPYAHHGVTSLRREEWMVIIAAWAELDKRIQGTKSASDLPDLNYIPKDVARAFRKNFRRNAAGLSLFIAELTVWIELTLQQHNEISILGI